MNRLAGKTTIVTGRAVGIGRGQLPPLGREQRRVGP